MLLSRMEEFCAYILPNGKRMGNKWVVGSSDGEQGKSFQVTMAGSKAGMFKDFAGEDKGGTPLWLLSQVKKIPFAQAVKEAADWLGIKADDYGVKRHKPKSYAKPDKAPIRQSEPNTKVMDYLTIERKIDPRVIAESKIAETENGETIVFNYADYDDETQRWLVAHRKYLDVDRPEGKKKMWATKDTKPCLYGKQMVGDDVRELLVSEGEIDQLSWLSWSIPAVSVPMGAKNLQWIDIDWDWLSRFEKIYIALDQDEVGIQAAQDVCKRLGIHRCYIVTMPKKDANECLQQGFTREQMLQVLKESKAIELDEIKRPSDFRQEVHDLYDVDPSKMGLETPWYPELPWRLRKAEFTILTGFSGGGKALDVSTPIPTPTGWTTMGDIRVGDRVFDENGKPCNVVLVTDFQYDRKCFSVNFSDGSAIIADEDHLWETWTPHARNSHARAMRRGPLKPKGTDQSHKRIQPQVVTTKEISETIYETKWKSGKHLRHAVPVTKPIEMPAVALPIDPYCLGYWLGNGTARVGDVTFGNGDEEVLENYRAAGYEIGHNKASEDRAPTHRIIGLREQLSSLNLIENKHVPKIYLRASAAQRLALLQGLMDSDGYGAQDGSCEFCSTTLELAEACQELLLSFGIRAGINEGRAMLYGKDCGPKYRVLFTPSIPVFRLKRKLDRLKMDSFPAYRNYRYITSVEPVASRPVKCIQVDSPRHLYLCGKAMIPTHNTISLNQLMVYAMSNGMKVLDASLEVRPGMTLYNMTRTALAKRVSTKEERNACINWLEEGMLFLDCVGTVNVDRLMQAMEYARKRHGVDVFVIDSLFKCGLSGEDYAGARAFVDRLTTFCNNTGAHVILVAHSRKTANGNELSPPSKSDVAGSSDITNAAFNVLVVWRNKLKKRKMDEAKQAGNLEEYAKWESEPDGKIILDKQRFGEGEECEIPIWFNRDAMQFHTVQGRSYPYFVMEGADQA